MPQFDVENRFSYYQSYSDNIMSGSAKPPWGGGWDRGVIGSVVSGSEDYKAATLLSDYTYRKTNPYYKSGEVRYLRMASSNHVIKDTITPNIVKLYQSGSSDGSGSLIGPAAGLAGVGIDTSLRLLFALDGNSFTASFTASPTPPRVNNTEWCWSFPYEKKYSYVEAYGTLILPPLLPVFTEKLTGWSPTGNITYGLSAHSETTNNTKYIVYRTTVSSSIRTSFVYLDQAGYYDSLTKTFNVTALSSTSNNGFLSQKTVFGINPKPASATFWNLGAQDKLYLCSGSTIDGWKYGLYNGIPTNFSAVFRQNKFGQFRDMLEGRFYTKTYNNPEIGGPMDADGGINFISASSLLGESDNWLTASIYGGTNVTEAYRVNPYGSGIFDKEYRASQPWHDDDPRVGT